MLSLHLAATLHNLLSTYTPSNILLRHLRTRRGLKWAIPVALVLVPTHLFAASLSTALLARGGPGWLNLLVLLSICYAASRVMPTYVSLPRETSI
jgi:hypothetical protein